VTSVPHPVEKPVGLTPGAALRYAWWIWFGLLFLPAFVFIGVVYALNFGHQPTRPTMGSTWFLINMAYLAIGIPAGFFFRSRMFHRYYDSQPVPPNRYLLGAVTVWTILEIGGLLSLAGVWYARSFTPNIIPALVAFVFYVTQFPKGTAMFRPTGGSDDPETYEEPR